MISGDILHGAWLPATQRLFVWGETAEPVRRKGRQPKIPLHPFQSLLPTLRERLDELGVAVELAEHTQTFWLPSASRAPLPSSELVATGAVELPRGAAELAPWQVTGLLLPAGVALDVLPALRGEDGHDRACGADLRFWRVAALLALQLLAGQQFMPALLRDGNRLRAAWRPRPDPPAAQNIAALAESLPPVCRAAVDDPAAAPTPRELVDDFLAAAVDGSVRLSLARSQAMTTPGGQWLEALLGPDPILNLKGRAADELFESWQSWVRQAQVAGDDVFRVTFRLEPPDEASDPWQLVYLLQASDDPSLLVPATLVWRERGPSFSYLHRRFEQPQERLLAALGYAARCFPPIEASLQQAAPEVARLSANEAFSFLTQAAPLLEQSGFGVLVPAWSISQSARLQLRARAKSVSSPNARSRLGLDTLVDFDWELSLGGETVERAEFERLVALKTPLVQLRGQWVLLDPAQMQKALAFFERHNGELDLSDTLRLALDTGAAEHDGIPVAEVDADGWLNDLLGSLRDLQQLELLATPGGLHGQLRPYQVRGYSWMAFLRRFGLGACLADDMGTGKCLAADTPVPINGTLRTIESIWNTYAGATLFDGEGYWATPTAPLLVNAIDEQSGRIVSAPVRRLYRQHVHEPMRKLRLADGSCITITRRHRLLTDKGWTNELQTGDYVCVPARLIWEGQPVDPDLVTFLAWQIAEGHEVHKTAQVSITQKDVRQLEELLQTIHRIGERYHLKINRPEIHAHSSRSAACLNLSSVAYRRFLTANGYNWGKLSREKSIPDFIMRADQDSVRLFLSHYFEAEGSAVAHMRSIEIGTASPLMIGQLGVLLRRFGIWMRVAAKKKCATNGKRIYRTYYIGIIGGNSARRFRQEIDFLSPRKQRKLEAICARTSNTNVEGIPASDLVADAVKTTNLPLLHWGMRSPVYIDGSQQFSRTSLERVLHGCDRILSGQAEQEYRLLPRSKWTKQTLEAYAHLDERQVNSTRQQLRRLLDQEVFYCRIAAIEAVEYEGWVYDLEIATHHNFVANNILCHNTIQTISLLLHEREQLGVTAPSLLVCPTSVIGNWVRELQRFAPSLRVMAHRGTERKQGAAFAEAAAEHDIVLTSYPLLARDQETLHSVSWGSAVLDEAQNIKNPHARQAQAARGIVAQNRVALTGTPVENRLSELWSIMAFLNPGYLGSEAAFRRELARPIERTGDQAARERLRRLTAPFVLRRLKTDPTIISDLPEKLEIKEYCSLTPEQATLYQAVVEQELNQIEASEAGDSAIARRGQVLAMLMKLKQVCNHPAQFLHDGSAVDGRSGKLQRLEEMLEEVYAVDERALIFTQFAEMGTLLQRQLQRVFGDVLFLHGGTPARERDAMVRRFEAPGGPHMFVLSLKAGGTGLNLVAANHVFHFDRWWNPAVENQATDRAFRIGQTRNVQVHKFICGGTLEEHIDELIESKRALAESVLGADESWLTELSTAQLRDLVALRRDEVTEG